MNKHFRYEFIFNILFKVIPACILGVAILSSFIFAMDSYIGVKGLKLKTLFIIIGVIFFQILVVLIYKKLINCNEKSINVIISIELIVLCAGLIIAGYFIQITNTYDLQHLHMSAMDYADNGDWGHTSYFSRFPMQRGWTVFLGLVYSLEKVLGITNYRIGGTVISVLIVFVTVYFSGKIIAILLGKKVEAVSLLFLILNPTFYVTVSYYYKDIPGVMCEILVLYLVLKGAERESKRYYMVAGMVAGIGYFILQSVGIGLIAAGVYILFSNESQKICKIAITAGCFLCVLCLLNYGVNAFYKWNLNEDIKFPLAAWFLTGLSGTGTYSSEINDYIASFPTYEEKADACILKLMENVNNSGFSGMLQLWLNKQHVIFGDGLSGITGYSKFVGDYNAIWRYSLGPKRLFMEYYAQIYRSVTLVNCLGAIIQVLKSKFDKTYLLFICVFGHVLWHSFYETANRYLLTFLPILIIFSVIGFSGLAEKINIASEESIQMISDGIIIEVKLRAAQKLCIILSLLSLLIFFSSFQSLFKDVGDETALRAANKGGYVTTLALSNEKVIGQTFRSRQCFNSIELQFDINGADENAIYKFELLNSDDEIIAQSKFDISQIAKGCIQFDFDEVVPDGWEYFTIQVFALSENNSFIAVYGTRTDSGYDFYNYGSAIGTDGVINDLYFLVNEKYYSVPYYPARMFILFLGIILIIEGIPIISIWKRSHKNSFR